jgi:hypothetical protein
MDETEGIFWITNPEERLSPVYPNCYVQPIEWRKIRRELSSDLM